MIKLVACDLDGTLLQNGSQALEPSFYDYVRKLQKMGITFVAASGRQYDNMRRLFEPVKEDIIFICENGTLVFYKEEVIHKSTMSRELGQRMLHAIWDKESAEILLSGEHTSYLQPKDEAYYEHMAYEVKNNVTRVADIFAVPEEYMKISVYEKEAANLDGAYWQKLFGNEANVVTSGNCWLDMMPKGVNKGMALKKVMEKFHIEAEKCVAFGDQCNDLEMLEEVGYGYAMENAHPLVKERCRYRTDRVEKILAKIIMEDSIR